MAFNETAYLQQFQALVTACEARVEDVLTAELARDHRHAAAHDVPLLSKLVTNRVFFEVYRAGAFVDLAPQEGRHVA